MAVQRLGKFPRSIEDDGDFMPRAGRASKRTDRRSPRIKSYYYSPGEFFLREPHKRRCRLNAFHDPFFLRRSARPPFPPRYIDAGSLVRR